jgi:hypothetical protein
LQVGADGRLSRRDGESGEDEDRDSHGYSFTPMRRM